jgi:hypothetical protein
MINLSVDGNHLIIDNGSDIKYFPSQILEVESAGNNVVVHGAYQGHNNRPKILNADYSDITIEGIAYGTVDTTTAALVHMIRATDVDLQDQHTPTLDTYFLQSISNFSLAFDTVASGATTFNYTFIAAPGHGIAIGNEVVLLDLVDEIIEYAAVINVVGDAITLDRPIDEVFEVATTLGRIVSSEMAVDGSVTEQVFTVRAGTDPVDITRLILTMLDDNAMDDSRFGGGSALARGVLLRVYDGRKQTIFNFKSNQDIKQFCFDVAYSDKAASGQHGLSARMSFGGQSKHGVTLRLSGDDVLQIIVQDDLTGLVSLKVVAEGHSID